MDIIKPDLLWIGSRCYRVNQTTNVSSLTGPPTLDKYVEQDDFFGDDDEAGVCGVQDDTNESEDYQIDEVNGRYSTSFHVPSQLFGQIIGAKGATRRRIETETNAQIQVPKQGQTGDIKITSNNAKSVAAARRRIEIIVIGAREKLNYTHFFSFPMNDEDIQKTFEDFKSKVLGDREIYGITEEFFQKPSKLHITIACVTLLDNVDRTQAANCLQECQETIINPLMQVHGPLNVQMKGLEIMNDDPSAVNILYSSVDCEGLQVISNKFYQYFVNKGMTRKQYDSVKLHVTLMNTRYTRSRDDPKEKGAGKFDASKILEKYGDFNFGTVKLKEIHLSQRHTTSSDGYYSASCTIKI